MSRTTETLLVSPNQITLFDLLGWTSSSEALPVKPSQSQDSDADSLTLEVASRWSSSDWRRHYALGGSSGRTSPESCHRTEDGRSVPSSGRWGSWGMGGPTESWTRSGSDWPSAAVVCSLSHVLQGTQDVPQRFFLSPRACAGILRRAEKRGKDLPPLLQRALAEVAGSGPTSTLTEDSSRAELDETEEGEE